MFHGHGDLVKSHVNKVDMAQEKLFNAQYNLIRAYERQWAEMNYLIENGQWDGKAVYLGNAYGMKVDIEMYVLQLDMPLPFLPNPYVLRFKENAKEYYLAKQLISEQLRDVIEQLGDGPMLSPAALLIKHYYQKVRIFDLDNKAKQVVINSFKNRLIKDDDIKHLPYYGEEGVVSKDGNRTMIYLGPDSKRRYMEHEIALKYERIDQLPGVTEGKYPAKFSMQCPPLEDCSAELVNSRSECKERKGNDVIPNCGKFL